MAVYVQVAGTQLALPDYAHPELAYTQQYDYGTIAAGQIVTQMVEANYIDIVLAAFFTVVTGPTGGNRIAFFDIRDENQNVIATTVAGGGQAASGTVTYALNIGLPFPTPISGGIANFGLPTIAAYPPYSYRLGVSGRTPDDVMSNVTANVLRVPTGLIGPDPTPPPAIAAPVLV